MLKGMQENQPLNKKTRSFILFLIDKMAIPTKTGIIKMCYLCDLAAVKSGMPQITDFKYVRYYYGPFDRRIEDYLLDLIAKKDIKSESEFTSGGGEFEKFSLPKHKKVQNDFDDVLSDDEARIVNPILDSLGSLNAKMLTEIAYRTNPMKELNATLGGTENLSKPLNLAA